MEQSARSEGIFHYLHSCQVATIYVIFLTYGITDLKFLIKNVKFNVYFNMHGTFTSHAVKKRLYK